RMKKLGDHTIKRIFVSPSGALEVGGKKVASLSALPGAEVEVTVRKGVVTAVKAAGESAPVKAKVFPVVYDRAGRMLYSFERLSGEKLRELDDCTIKNFMTDEQGNIRVGSENICSLGEYPNTTVELSVEQGVVTAVRVVRAGKAVREKKLSLIYDDTTGALSGSFGDALVREKLAALAQHTIKRVSTDSRGNLSIGGEVVCRLSKYPDTEVELSVEQGVVTGVKAVKDGAVLEEKQFSLVYDADGKLVDSFDELFFRSRMRGLSGHVIKNFFTDAQGRISIGGEGVCRLSKYPNTGVELTVEQGVVSAVKVVKDGAVLEERQLSLVYGADGKLVDSFDVLPGEKLRRLERHTIRRYFAGASGAVSLGGEYLGSLPDYPGAELEIDVEQGVVTALRVMQDGRAVFEKKFTLVYDADGRLVKSFGEVLAPGELKALSRHTIKRFYTSELGGAVQLGGEYVCRLPAWPGTEAELDVEDGLVTAVRALRDGKVAAEKKMSLVYDNRTGRPVDSFAEAFSREKLSALSDHTIRRFVTDSIGLVFVGSEYVCRLADYPGAEVELTVSEGKVTAVTLVRDRDGNAPLDVYGQPLVIDPSQNVKAQMERKSRDLRERRLMQLQALFAEAQQLFLEGDRAGASKLLARFLVRIGDQSTLTLEEAALLRQARQYLDLCRDFLKEQRLAGRKEAIEKRYAEQREALENEYRAAESLFVKGDYQAALSAFVALSRKTPRDSELSDNAKERARDCRGKLNFHEAEKLYESGRYADASRKFREAAKNSEEDSELSLYAGRKMQDSRLRALYLDAEVLFDRGKFPQALAKYRAVLKAAEQGSEIYLAAQKSEAACRDEIAAKKEMIPLSIRRFYTEKPAVEASALLARVAERRAALDSAGTKNALNAFAESQMWLIKEVAGQFTSELYDFYEELVSEGFLETYEAADSYLELAPGARPRLEDYLRERLRGRFRSLRTVNNRHLYQEKSLQSPIGRQSSKWNGSENERTLENVIPKQGPSVEDDIIEQDEMERVKSLLGGALGPEKTKIVMMVITDGMSAEEAAEQSGYSVDEVKGILSEALQRIHDAPSLGSGIEGLVAHAVEALTKAEPHAALLAALAAASGNLARQLAALYRAGVEVSNEAGYRAFGEKLAQAKGIDRVEIWDSGYLSGGGGWSFATLETDAQGVRTLLINRVLLDELKAQGPPAHFEPGRDKKTREERFLLAVAGHEIDECLALGPQDGALPWLAGFNAYLPANALPRSRESFHRYLKALALKENLSGHEKALAAQAALLEFAENILAAPRVVELSSFPAGLAVKDFPDYHNILIRGCRLDRQGALYLAGKTRAKFSGYPGEKVEVLVSDGHVMKVIFPDRNEEREFALIIDNATGRITGSFAGRLAPELFRRLESATIKNYSLSRDGRLEVGGRSWARFTGRENGKVEVLVRDGMVAGVRFSDGAFQRFAQVYDAREKKVTGSFLTLRGKDFAALEDAVIRNYRLDESGTLNMAGMKNVARFRNHPGAEVEIAVRQGVAVRVSVVEDGKTVEEKNLSVVYDNATGRPVHSFENLTADKLSAFNGHTIRNVFTDSAGVLQLGGGFVGRYSDYPNAELALEVKDGRVARVSFLKDREGARIADLDGRPLEVKPGQEDARKKMSEARGRKLLQFRVAEMADYPQGIGGEVFSRLDDVVIKGYVLGAGGVLKIGGKAWSSFRSRGGEELEIYVKQGQVAKVVFPKDNTEEDFTLVADNASGKAVDSFRGRLSAEKLKALEDATLRNFPLDGREGAVNLGGRAWAQFREHAGERAEVTVKGGVVIAVRFADGAARELPLVCDRATGRILDAFRPAALAGLDNVVLKKCRVDADGLLRLGNRVYEGFEEYPDEEIELDIDGGAVRSARVLRGGEAVFETVPQESFPAEKETAKIPSSRKLYTDDRGTLWLGTRSLGAFPGYPDAEVELTLRAGRPVKAVFIKDERGEPVRDNQGDPLEIDLRGNVERQLAEKLLTPEERRRAGIAAAYEQAYKWFTEGRYDEASKAFSGVVAAVKDPLRSVSPREAALADRAEYYRLVCEKILASDKKEKVNNGTPALVSPETRDASLRPVGKDELVKLDNVVIERHRLTKNGALYLGGRTWATFSGRPYAEVRVGVKDGCVVKAVFPDGPEALFSLITDNTTGRAVDSYFSALSPARMGMLADATVRGVKLGTEGQLVMGGRKWASFDDWPGETVDVVVKDGAAAKVVNARDGAERALSLVQDNVSGRVVDSFYRDFGQERLEALQNITVTGFTLDTSGRINFGDRRWGRFEGRAGQNVDFVVKEGVLRSVRFEDGTGQEFALVYDGAGKILGSFIDRPGRVFAKDEIRIRRYFLEQEGRLKIFGQLIGKFFNYPRAEVELLVRGGEVVSVKFVRNMHREPVLDIFGNPLELDPRLDIRSQMSEKSADFQEKKLARAIRTFERAKGFFMEDRFNEAARLFASVVVQLKGGSTPLLKEALLVEKAELYLEIYHNIIKSRRGEERRFSRQAKLEMMNLAALRAQLKELLSRRDHRGMARLLKKMREGSLELRQIPGFDRFVAEAEGYVRQVRLETLFLQAERLYNARQFSRARAKYRQMLNDSSPGSDRAAAAGNRLRDCANEMESGRAFTPLTIKRYYAEPVMDRAREEELLARLAAVDASLEPGAREADILKSRLSENYIWLIKDVAKRFANPERDNDYYDELVSEGFLLLHEALGSFIGGEGGISLEEFVRRAAAARFDALRKERNRV
ncbi:MAG: sigma-70 family RNA polymerase sigma factor, partial [Endomicrobiales bacterium]